MGAGGRQAQVSARRRPALSLAGICAVAARIQGYPLDRGKVETVKVVIVHCKKGFQFTQNLDLNCRLYFLHACSEIGILAAKQIQVSASIGESE